jgi:hypothetical protein
MRPTAAAELHLLPSGRQELLRRLNLAARHRRLVDMRGQLLMRWRRDNLAAVDTPICSPVLVMFQPRLPGAADRWSTPAVVLEKIIRYGRPSDCDWDDLRARTIRRTGAATPSSIRRWSMSR